jgi:hypothetical protein
MGRKEVTKNQSRVPEGGGTRRKDSKDTWAEERTYLCLSARACYYQSAESVKTDFMCGLQSPRSTWCARRLEYTLIVHLPSVSQACPHTQVHFRTNNSSLSTGQ